MSWTVWPKGGPVNTGQTCPIFTGAHQFDRPVYRSPGCYGLQEVQEVEVQEVQKGPGGNYLGYPGAGRAAHQTR